MQETIKRLDDEGVRAESAVEFGRPAEAIVDVARREGCGLIAMSTHGRSALGRGILGSISDKVIHSSHLPTMIITPERAEHYWQDGANISKIMVLLDGSEIAETVLPYVENLAKKLPLEVVLVRVARISSLTTHYAGTYLYYADNVDLEREIEAEAVEYLKGIANGLRVKGITVQWKLLRGNPAQAILELAKETPRDIITLATHGRSGLTRLALGSVAEVLVRASVDPVLVIPPKQIDES